MSSLSTGSMWEIDLCLTQQMVTWFNHRGYSCLGLMLSYVTIVYEVLSEMVYRQRCLTKTGDFHVSMTAAILFNIYYLQLENGVQRGPKERYDRLRGKRYENTQGLDEHED